MNSINDSSSALFVADNLALDFINSEYGVGEQHHDCLADDQGVVDWLQRAGLLPEASDQAIPAQLSVHARRLRACSRALVNAAMKGQSAELTVINEMFEAGRPIRALGWNDATRAFEVVTRPRDSSAASLLWPVVDALVSLVSHDKFEYVRECEAHDCVLLFQDLTKSHRRRWCSMATCGNRMKVAAFRSRNKP